MPPSPSQSNGWAEHKRLVEFQLNQLSAGQTTLDGRLDKIERKLSWYEGVRSVIAIVIAAMVALGVTVAAQ